jgi:mRNA-degrading endonuclease RelE of RelBE toxin-antitoxin system
MQRALKHFANPEFWEHYKKLPASVPKLADKNFELLKKDSQHPSLQLKRVGKYWSVRIGRKYRAVGVEAEAGLIWFWIGKHSEYDKLLKQ